MSLTFQGTKGVGVVSYRFMDGLQGTYTDLPDVQWLGGFFTPSADFRLDTIVWGEAKDNLTFGGVFISNLMRAYVWNADGDIVSQAQFLPNWPAGTTTNTFQLRVNPVTLTGGKPYCIAMAYPAFTKVPATGTNKGASYPSDPSITWGNAAEEQRTLSQDPTPPPTTGSANWKVSLGIQGTLTTPVTQDTPPDPIVKAGPQQFAIAVDTRWMPASIQEWTLQYQKGPDGGEGWSNWFTLGSFPITENVYLHSGLDPFDNAFYTYRYMVRSQSEQSAWSEVTFAGRVMNAVVAGEDGSIDLDSLIPTASIGPQQLNINQLSAISADIGTVSAGTLRGPLFETSASNPRVYMQQGIGLQATDTGGANVFSLDSTSGALTLKGAIQSGSTITGTTLTGGVVQTASSGKRVVMDSTGLGAYNATGTRVLDFSISTGVLTISGVVSGSAIIGGSITSGTTITGSTITGGTIQTATTGSRVVMTSASLIGYHTDGTTERFKLDTSTGAFTMTGASVKSATSGARLELTPSGTLEGYNSSGTKFWTQDTTGIRFTGLSDASYTGSPLDQYISWKDPHSTNTAGYLSVWKQTVDDTFNLSYGNNLELKVATPGGTILGGTANNDAANMYLTNISPGGVIQLALRTDGSTGTNPVNYTHAYISDLTQDGFLTLDQPSNTYLVLMDSAGLSSYKTVRSQAYYQGRFAKEDGIFALDFTIGSGSSDTQTYDWTQSGVYSTPAGTLVVSGHIESSDSNAAQITWSADCLTTPGDIVVYAYNPTGSSVSFSLLFSVTDWI